MGVWKGPFPVYYAEPPLQGWESRVAGYEAEAFRIASEFGLSPQIWTSLGAAEMTEGRKCLWFPVPAHVLIE